MEKTHELYVGSEGIIKGKAPTILRSGGLGPCTAIGIFNKEDKTGYMLHEPYFLYADLEEKLEIIKKDYARLDNLKVYVTGNSLSSQDDENQRNFEFGDREYVENTLKKYFTNKQIKFDWLKDDLTTELSLNLNTGKFTTDVEPLEDVINKEFNNI